jgi:hypothetical protein
VRLIPSILRSTISVLRVMLILAVATYFYQGFVEHKWWSLDYVLSLAIPVATVPAAVWFMFVPGHLEFDDLSLFVQPRFRSIRTLPWSEMINWGKGEGGVFCIRFGGGQTISILSSAYPPEQWKNLTEFLSAKFPDRKADDSVGTWSLRKRR